MLPVYTGLYIFWPLHRAHAGCAHLHGCRDSQLDGQPMQGKETTVAFWHRRSLARPVDASEPYGPDVVQQEMRIYQPTDIVVESEGKILAVPLVSLLMHILVDGGKIFRGVLS